MFVRTLCLRGEGWYCTSLAVHAKLWTLWATLYVRAGDGNVTFCNIFES